MRRLLATLTLLAPLTAAAQTYRVEPGDSLGTIAERHGITVEELARLNGITNPDRILPGQELVLTGAEGEVVARGVLHLVRRGVTLGHIAKAYGTSRASIAKANRIRDPHLVREGMRILVPGAKRVVPIATKVREPCLRAPVELYKVRTDETRHIVLARCSGAVWEPGREELSRFLDRTGDESPVLLDRLLLKHVQTVAERFPGRRVEVVSAYRAPVGEQRASSRHCKAKAMDFRVSGVPNTRLRDFARTLGNVGVGFYPNSTFIHLDVRERPAFWVDWSGPGEPARYGRLDADPAARARGVTDGRQSPARRAGAGPRSSAAP